MTSFHPFSRLLSNHLSTLLELVRSFALQQPELLLELDLGDDALRGRIREAALLFATYLLSNYARASVGQEQVREKEERQRKTKEFKTSTCS